mmetsp:Transcript_102241/g.153172  ORF Transcript_102241/g.153172 Transcript_102241/m.153172 type:complete len:455 (+) Transcript_102241:99-1463(+)
MSSFFSFALLVLAGAILRSTDAEGTKLQIKNRSGAHAAINWVNPDTREAVPFSDIAAGASFAANTFLGHEFQFVELQVEATGKCQQEKCKVANFVVSEETHQTAIVTTDFQIVSDSDLGEEEEMPEDVTAYCREQAKEKLQEAKGDTEEEKRIITELGECIKAGVTPKFQKLKEEYEFEFRIRETIASQMENFTCLDPDLGTSPDVDFVDWTSEKDNVTRSVHVKLDRPASRIHVIENFANVDECDAMAQEAEPRLHDASVADGKGGIRFSENRKAKQAGITPDFSKEEEGNLVARLSRRVYDYTNFALGMNLTEHGQEPLMSIQYFGRGYDDGEPDRYTPHCDGRCDGESHPYGTRMATMVIYCTIPERGGHTNFQNAGVHIKPEVGNAIFFSYIDPKTNLTDHSLTQHSGCPVFEGEKKIITQWVRYGVDSNERSHARFNTLGILHAESGEN